ncbi:hypothetical protein EDD18DRAFT_1360625 [Armillaria luteobubalina]|uniref:Uncharacterized protein n=1 Tax=Armillaria luteobubalina TaxID=153913 RepID=A0AA39PML3_9AGAR|nr:hypothetical protein EDD18DRAFT_1360625 [Armillaria luteobubalina]
MVTTRPTTLGSSDYRRRDWWLPIYALFTSFIIVRFEPDLPVHAHPLRDLNYREASACISWVSPRPTILLKEHLRKFDTLLMNNDGGFCTVLRSQWHSPAKR